METEKKENIWRRKIYIFAEEKEKEEIIWRRKINGDADKRTNRPTGQIEQSVFEKYETEKLLVAS